MAATNETYEPYLLNKKKVGTKIFADGKLIGVWVPFKNKTEVDLHKEVIPDDTTRLLLDKVKRIKGLDKLLALDQLERLSCINADGEPVKLNKKSAQLENLSLNGCTKTLTNTLLAMFDKITVISITDYNAPIEGGRIAAIGGIDSLYLEGIFIKDLPALQQLALKELYLYGFDADQQLTDFLQSQSKLEILHLLTPEPIQAADVNLDSLKHLKELKLINHPSTQKEWTAWAKSKKITLELLPEDYIHAPAKAPKYELDEVYKNVSILKVTRSSKARFEVSDDLIKIFHLKKTGNNGDLEEALVEKLDPQKKTMSGTVKQILSLPAPQKKSRSKS